MLTVILVAFLVGLSEGDNWGWTSPRGARPVRAQRGRAAAGLGLVELRQPEPLVDVRMLATAASLVANLTALLAGFAMYAAFVGVPQFVQARRRTCRRRSRRWSTTASRGSATEAGLVLLPGALDGPGHRPARPAGSGMRYGFACPWCWAWWSPPIGLASLATFHDEQWQVVVGMTITGAGVPFTFAAMAKIVVDAVRPQETAVATGMNTVMRTIGGVIGGQLLAVILTADTIGDDRRPRGVGLHHDVLALRRGRGAGGRAGRSAARRPPARRRESAAGRGAGRRRSGQEPRARPAATTRTTCEELRILYARLAPRGRDAEPASP